MGGEAHATNATNIGRREVRHRPVDFHREMKRSEGGEGEGNLPPPDRGTTRGGDKCKEGSLSIPCRRTKIIMNGVIEYNRTEQLIYSNSNTPPQDDCRNQETPTDTKLQIM